MCDATLAAIAMVGSAGISILGQQQQAAAAKEQLRYKNAILANQRTVIQQDIKAEKDAELLRQQLISEAGSVREGEIVVAQADLGQLVHTGSAGDTTADLAAEVAFKKLVSSHESKLRERRFAIAAGDIEGAMGLNTLRAEQDRVAANFASVGTILTTGASFGSKFEFNKAGKTWADKFKFRSRVR